MLHAHELGFTHPRTGKKLKFKAPFPDDSAMRSGAASGGIRSAGGWHGDKTSWTGGDKTSRTLSELARQAGEGCRSDPVE